MLKKTIPWTLSVLLVLLLFPAIGFAAEGNAPAELYVMADGQRIDSKTVNDVPYLFLPASIDQETLEIQGAENEEAIASLQIMTGSRIPTIFLNSSDLEHEGREYVDASKSNVTTGSMKMTDADGGALYDGALTQIKARGNSTFTYADKKSYQIKLDKKSDLLGTGEKAKTWVLLAGANDATKIHDKTMKDFASSLGMPYVAGSTWVDLYYDGEYRGLYLLSEKNQVNKTSVNITDMEEAYDELNENYGEDPVTLTDINQYGQTYQYTRGLTDPENISGGYLLELNGSKIDEASGFYTRKERAVNVKSPEWASENAMAYISEFYQEFEDAVYATDPSGNYTGYNKTTGKYYYDYVDKESLVKTFLMKELSLNVDDFVYSTFLYKDKDSDKLFCGPIWDQEMIFGTGWGFQVSPTSSRRNYLEEALIQIPDFQNAVKEYYRETFADQAKALSGEEGTIAASIDLIRDSVEMDHVLWRFVRAGSPLSYHYWPSSTSYQEIIDMLNDWVDQRLAYLDKQYLEDNSAEDEPGNGGNGNGGGGIIKPDPIPLDDPEPDEPEPTDEPAPDILFEDVPDDAYFCDPVKWAVEKEITTGMDETHFGPELSCTRAQMVTFLWRAAGSPEPTGGSSTFTDVEVGSYYEKAVLWAVEKGITTGTSDTTFSPEDNVTRGQSVTFLYRMTNPLSQSASLSDSSPEGGAEEISFTDVAEDAYYFDAVLWAAANGVTTGTTETTFSPEEECTRAQIVTFLYRAMAK